MSNAWRMLPLILVSVLLSAAAQLSFKYGMMRPAMQIWLARGQPDFSAWLHVPVNAAVVGGLALYGASTCLWLLVLARVNLSVAYPFVGLGFIATMLFGALFLGEPLTLWRMLGTLLIALGVVLVAS
jgi:multidrug transporter EmrE-like cation transporter